MNNIYIDYQNICSKDKYYTISQTLSNGNERIIIFKNSVSSSVDSFEINKNGEIEVENGEQKSKNNNMV